jgi:prepilin-type N-terminal cleavage/methylation domain-containing protein
MKASRIENGFTLLELLVAAAITLVLAGIMLSVAAGALVAWRRAQGMQDTAVAASLALDLLERDLQSAMVRNDTNVWLASDVINSTGQLAVHGWFVTGAIKPAGAQSQQLLPSGPAPQIEEARFGLSGCWLRFFTGKLDTNGTGRDLSAPSAVAYQILRRQIGATGGEARYRLFRADVRQTASGSGRPGTFQSGYDITLGNYATASSTQGDAGTVLAPALADALADNVVDFGLWFYVRTSNGDLQRIYPTTNADLSWRMPQGGVVPQVADVMLRVLTQDGATQVNAIESGLVARPAIYATDADWWWAVALANSAVFTRRIELKGSAP